MSGLRRRLVSVAAATALLGGAGVPAVMLAPAAAAHSVLIATDPENGSELENSPEQVELTFNEEINQNFVTVTVRQDDDSTNRVTGEPTVDGDTVTAQVEGHHAVPGRELASESQTRGPKRGGTDTVGAVSVVYLALVVGDRVGMPETEPGRRSRRRCREDDVNVVVGQQVEYVVEPVEFVHTLGGLEV